MNKYIYDKLKYLQYDHEKSKITHNIEYKESNDLYLVKDKSSNSPYSNKVTLRRKFKGEELEGLLEICNDFFESNYSVWTCSDENENVQEFLSQNNFDLHDTYDNLYYEVMENEFYNESIKVKSDKHLKDMATIVMSIWGSDCSIKEAVARYKTYSSSEDCRGNYVIHYKDEIPVGYGNYRLSDDYKCLYLSGSAVLENYRGNGYLNH